MVSIHMTTVGKIRKKNRSSRVWTSQDEEKDVEEKELGQRGEGQSGEKTEKEDGG